jgi:hypothetical protein
VAPPSVSALGASSIDTSSSMALSGSNIVLGPLYQQLYAVVVVQMLTSCLEAPEAVAAQRLAGLRPLPACAVLDDGAGHLGQVLASAANGQAGSNAQVELEHSPSEQVNASVGRVWRADAWRNHEHMEPPTIHAINAFATSCPPLVTRRTTTAPCMNRWSSPCVPSRQLHPRTARPRSALSSCLSCLRSWRGTSATTAWQMLRRGGSWA